jgi:hypothetical protein
MGGVAVGCCGAAAGPQLIKTIAAQSNITRLRNPVVVYDMTNLHCLESDYAVVSMKRTARSTVGNTDHRR